ncbi:undecaprenyldiphospho-muramoylpentapeptide beta-N-acetylglucosaminyltransferase [Idiomarina tyrosinivorans]|uniref:UDP-N-acetylglucosamine--N-acetylmuramyl-(pentapeptide) pyrophosphoryl-undecaprenol N-acetylglucosamine transferase n=1 Tax=Idiomarina tyrosinivorans TaxID=1445662 RepID=A0A432ZQA5_9GAMM|nr:undecaprenyldiphospho-muramoylpentapeptide beta-N-acetylglucosaminyltransferase [Idiomarina tyrosinivorans]RUO80080.1 undecaprenyldiphospho-muramoylpentapeptide beta-N-acetylglucosaminyltransferase [Idiomarina tyrosinivorans]
MNRVMIVAAGTGGHVFPALAVAEQLLEQNWQVEWLGTHEQRLESKVVPAAGIKLHQITMSGLRGRGVKGLLAMPLRLLRAVSACRKLFKQYRPSVVATFGGYVCAPAGIAAKMLGIPLVTHEQNAVPGTTTRLLAKFTPHVMLGLPVNLPRWDRFEVCGNPLRKAFVKAANSVTNTRSEQSAKPLTIAVVGGSLGAHKLNQVVPLALQQLAQPLTVVHQCGERDQPMVQQAYQNCAQIKADVVPFIEDMLALYQQADLVISRAGALTVAEIAATGVASILVPLPHAIDDHQRANAEVLVNAGAAKLMLQDQLTVESLAETIDALLQPSGQLWKMAAAAKQASYPHATQRVATKCQEIQREFGAS